jgi:hypothetical protein
VEFRGTGLSSESESESEKLYDWRFTAYQFVLAPSLLRPMTRIFSQLNTCGCSPYVTSSLTRGWICRLQLLLVLASAVILGSESRWAHDHNSLAQIRDSPNLESQVSVYIPQNSVPSYTTRHSVPISSPPTTSRATVEVLDSTYARLWTLFSRCFSLYNLGTGSIEDTAPAVPLFYRAYPLPR